MKIKKIIIFLFICFPLFAEDIPEDIEKEVLKEIEKTKSNFLNYNGEFQLRVSRINFDSYYFPNVFKIKSQNNLYLDIRPDFYFNFLPEIEGVIKPRISMGLETEDRREKQIFSENVMQIGLYEAYLTGILNPNQKIRFGLIDLTRGFGKIFNPGNLWQSENQSANPYLENSTKLSFEYILGINKYFSLRGIIDSNYTNENFRVVAPNNPALEKEKNNDVFDTTNLYEANRKKFEEELNQKFNYEKRTELVYDGVQYEKKDILDKIDHPIFYGGEIIFNTDNWEVRLSAKYAHKVEAQYGYIMNYFITKEILLYLEGNLHRGRSVLIPVETGKKARKEQNKENYIIRFADPIYDLRDQPYSYGFIIDQELKQYEFLYNNRHYTREALGGLQFSINNFTFNIEYAYDGKGYSKKEYQRYIEAIYWASGAGSGRLENIYQNIWIYDYKNQQFKQMDLELFQTSILLSQNIFNSISSKNFPKRLGQHYALLEINYTNEDQTIMIIPRITTNLEDHSSLISFYMNYEFLNPFRVFFQSLYFTGKRNTEFNRFIEKSYLLGISYFW